MPEAIIQSRAISSLQERRFEDFYRTNWDSVYRPLAVTLRDDDLAAEATDEAMTRALARWPIVRRHRNPAGWVYRVGLNWARSRLRKRGRERPGGVPPPAGHDDDPFDPALADALASLSLDHRAVVVLRYLLDLSQEQIADTLELPIGTVRSRLARALDRLREEVAS